MMIPISSGERISSWGGVGEDEWSVGVKDVGWAGGVDGAGGVGGGGGVDGRGGDDPAPGARVERHSR